MSVGHLSCIQSFLRMVLLLRYNYLAVVIHHIGGLDWSNSTASSETSINEFFFHIIIFFYRESHFYYFIPSLRALTLFSKKLYASMGPSHLYSDDLFVHVPAFHEKELNIDDQ